MFEPLLALDSADSVATLASQVPQAWKDFWTWTFTVGISAFYVLVIIMIPLGLRDLLRLLARLNASDD